MNEFTLIWVNEDYDLTNPKGLQGMDKDKALGSIAWTKKILTKKQKCFIYDPSDVSIFNDDGSKNIVLIEKLCIRYSK